MSSLPKTVGGKNACLARCGQTASAQGSNRSWPTPACWWCKVQSCVLNYYALVILQTCGKLLYTIHQRFKIYTFKSQFSGFGGNLAKQSLASFSSIHEAWTSQHCICRSFTSVTHWRATAKRTSRYKFRFPKCSEVPCLHVFDDMREIPWYREKLRAEKTRVYVQTRVCIKTKNPYVYTANIFCTIRAQCSS